MKNVIGQIGTITFYSDADRDFHVDVVISDVRHRYGNTDYRVTPLSGTGHMWKRSDNVTNIRQPEQQILSDDDLDLILECE